MAAYLLLALASVAWLVAGLYYALGLAENAGLLLNIAGFAVAFWASRDPEVRPARVAAGLGLAFVGTLLFIGEGLGSFEGVGLVASHLFALALVGTIVGLYAARSWLPRAAWAVAAIATLLWVYNDRAFFAWQPGNLAAFVGAAWLAYEG